MTICHWPLFYDLLLEMIISQIGTHHDKSTLGMIGYHQGQQVAEINEAINPIYLFIHEQIIGYSL